MSDLISHLSPAVTLPPALRTAAATGTAVDLATYDAAVVLVHAGAWTDGVHTVEIQESDSSGTGFTPVADADLAGTEPSITSAGTASQIYAIGYKGIKRYLKASITGSGATGAVVGVSVIRGKGRVQP